MKITHTKRSKTSVKCSTQPIKAAVQDLTELEEIREQCYHKLLDTMVSEFGFTRSEAKQYCRCDADISNNNWIIQIGAELSYDGLNKIAEACNPIVQQLDPDAYFGPVDPGITEAWITPGDIMESKEIKAAYDVPDLPLEPPESPWSEIEGEEGQIEVDLDDYINVDEDGDWSYEDDDCTWAQNQDREDGDWYDDEYHVYLDDASGVADKVDDLLADNARIPGDPGRYHVTGTFILTYDLENLWKTKPDKYGDFDTSSEDGSGVYSKSKSQINSFNFEVA